MVDPTPVDKTEPLENQHSNTEPSGVTLWQYLEWRCDFVSDDDAPTLRLFMGDRLVQSEPAADPFGIIDCSVRWFDIAQGVSREPVRAPSVPIPNRRSVADRRCGSRGGRREQDIH